MSAVDVRLEGLAAELAPLVAEHLAPLVAAPAPDGALLDAKGAAALLSVPESWVRQEARAERIPHVMLGRYVRFDADELERWWRARSRGPKRGG